jgi:4-amino-4-deoxy-L-arabinose transferase-like glycosyltransferase
VTLRGALLVAALTVLSHLQLFARPYYNADETIYGAIANRINAGEVLYQGAVDHKPPAIYYTYAFTFRIFGRNAVHAVHAVSVVWVLATALLVGAIARTRSGEAAGVLAALLYGMYTSASIPKWFLAANAELFMQLPTVAALAIVLWWPRRAVACVGAGVLVGVASLYKLQGIFAALPVAFLIVADDRARPTASAVVRALPRLLLAAAGVLLPLLLVAIAFRAAGAWDDLMFWPLGYASRYAVSTDLAEALGKLAARGSFFCYTLPALPIGAVLAMRELRHNPDRVGVGAIVWVGASFIAVCIGGRFFAHYFIMLLPPLCILAAPVLHDLVRGARSRMARVALVALIAAPPVAFFVYAPWNDDYLSIDPREPRALAAVGEFIQRTTPAQARLFVWGNSTEIYFHADRLPATRFVFTNYQTGKMWGTPANQDDAPLAVRARFIVPESWPMLLDDLAAHPPDVIVDAAAGGLNAFRGLAMESFPELRMVLERYRLAGTIEGVPIYFRRNDVVNR